MFEMCFPVSFRNIYLVLVVVVVVIHIFGGNDLAHFHYFENLSVSITDAYYAVETSDIVSIRPCVYFILQMTG